MSFDVSNQKTLANFDAYGSLKMLTFYRENLLTEEKPGVWVNKQLSQTSNISLTLEVDGVIYDLSKPDHLVTADIIKDSLPRFIHSYPKFTVYLVPFAPITEGKRLSMLIEQVFIVNTSGKKIKAILRDIPLYQKKYSDQQNILIFNKASEKEIEPGESGEYSVALVDPNSYAQSESFKDADLNQWLNDTLDYFDGIYGDLKLEDEKLAHLYRRALYQSFSSFGMDSGSKMVGSNWGSYPATNRIWNKDMYYASLPFIFFDENLCQETILWFTKFGVKFPGSKFPGGINHSLSNSLSSALLSTLYFEYTSDLEFFKKHTHVLEVITNIIDTVISQKNEEDPFLFQSTWISDAFSLGKYHTGSNICLWKACQGVSKILLALDMKEKGIHYQKLADCLKNSILENMTTDGPFGRQFLEGIGDIEKDKYSIKHYQKPILEQGLIFLSDVIEDGQINLLMHDGEESDTTLIPFYQFLSQEDSIYKQTLEFTASKFNPTYSEDIEGITWGLESGATFPGFTTVLMSSLLEKDKFSRRLQELFNLADLDGSWWWWPYKLEASKGDVVRDFGCGKCAWASGIFVSTMLTQYFGLSFEQGALKINPVDYLEFTWKNLHIGKAYVSIECSRDYIEVLNLSETPLEIYSDSTVLNFKKDNSIKIRRKN
ncbi:glycoside hydrolase [Streptococcaceae bacterium ESL0687]|nr:glycoside hydrolase [Streptococcaceae bacterium ESL0687]